ncbi:GPO family capsid scaffolding protein [Iodobacter ciconiae]|uniref:GPO family capsid scaffolding protein n=1 Tax=Iodobacter ciconiae TaxID=2496266 RepID=A0A3S8ZPX7_9NEIS|nr:GPO family capsid scaffolding protein [Iodobacter ciconiae]AZN35541.1 GPO family capsid scaffolding protein [Iodobacter ciconiae]
MDKKFKSFQVATEGSTTDGRTITREWLSQMAKNYNPKKFGARINIEHIKDRYPNSAFKAYGDVIALEAKEIDGKMALFATIDPTPELVALNRSRQKVFTSVEIDPDFADSGEAYLVGLAVTDNPASLGVEMLKFSASAGKNSPLLARKTNQACLFTDAIEFALEEEGAHAVSMLESVKKIFSKKEEKETLQYADMQQAMEAIAEQTAKNSDGFKTMQSRIDELKSEVTELREFKSKVENEPSHFSGNRGKATGGAVELLTDC